MEKERKRGAPSVGLLLSYLHSIILSGSTLEEGSLEAKEQSESQDSALAEESMNGEETLIEEDDDDSIIDESPEESCKSEKDSAVEVKKEPAEDSKKKDIEEVSTDQPAIKKEPKDEMTSIEETEDANKESLMASKIKDELAEEEKDQPLDELLEQEEMAILDQDFEVVEEDASKDKEDQEEEENYETNSQVKGHFSLKDTLALQLGVVLYRSEKRRKLNDKTGQLCPPFPALINEISKNSLQGQWWVLQSVEPVIKCSRPYAFIHMFTVEAAVKAIQAIITECEGMPVRLGYGQLTKNREVLVSNIPPALDRRKLRDLFYQCGDVGCLILDRNTAQAVIVFSTFSQAHNAVVMMRGREFHGQRIMVQYPVIEDIWFLNIFIRETSDKPPKSPSQSKSDEIGQLVESTRTPPLPVPSPNEKGGSGAVTSSLKNLGSAGPADST
ncbi:SPEN, partial [Cordylochernes scorpioides]